MRKIFLLLVLVFAFVPAAFCEEIFAVVNSPFAPFITEDNTRDDEAIYGMVIQVEEISGDLVRVKMPYGLTIIERKNIQLVPRETAENWKASITHQIITPFADVQPEAATSSYPPVITLPRGAYLKIGEENSSDKRYVKAELFNGVNGWIRKPIVRPVRKWGEFDEEQTRKNLVDDAKKYLGTAYRWGGRTPEGVDCSGLMHVIYNLNGLEIHRNSRPKFGFPMALKHVAGTPEDTHTLDTLKDIKPGDLIHWPGHVGMYIGDGKFLHANGTDFSTTISSLFESDENYRADLARPSEINTFSTAFPERPDELNIKEFYALPFTSGDVTGYKFYVRVDGYAPTKAIIYPEGVNSDVVIEIEKDIPMFHFVYSSRTARKAPAYFYPKSGNYKPAVKLINDEGFLPSGKIISSDIFEMDEKFFVGGSENELQN